MDLILCSFTSKVVLLEPPERYYEPDNWPSEQDRGLYLRLAMDVPLLQKTVIYLLRLGLSKEHPVSCVEALEIVEQLVIRASSLAFSLSIPVLPGTAYSYHCQRYRVM
jgi:integrator complex subunit 1